LRFASPGHLIDINRVQGLDFLDERDATLQIGPLFRHKAAERSSLLASRYPVMAEAARQVADPIIRNRGTIGGSLAPADPAGDRVGPPAAGARPSARRTARRKRLRRPAEVRPSTTPLSKRPRRWPRPQPTRRPTSVDRWNTSAMSSGSLPSEVSNVPATGPGKV